MAPRPLPTTGVQSRRALRHTVAANLAWRGDAAVETPKIKGAPDDLTRNVHALLGVPIDAVDMEVVLTRIRAAAVSGTSFLLSTPNLDFLTISRSDKEFRDSLLLSDLCPPDGMPIVWISRLLGIPITQRIAGADIFATLKSAHRSGFELSVFLFGGAEGVVARASQRINEAANCLTCVGWLNPGFLPVEEMSGANVIDVINRSNADFLAVGLSARKGQIWLLRNHHRLSIPVRASLGATINFEAGTLERAPAFLRLRGLEWLWRIKEEPYLWARYWRNLRELLYLVPARVLPLAILLWCNRRRTGDKDLLIRRHQEQSSIVLTLSGAAVEKHVAKIAAWFRNAVAAKRPVTIDMTEIRAIDTRFLGQLLMLRKLLMREGLTLKLTGTRLSTRLLLHLNGFGFLLAPK